MGVGDAGSVSRRQRVGGAPTSMVSGARVAIGLMVVPPGGSSTQAACQRVAREQAKKEHRTPDHGDGDEERERVREVVAERNRSDRRLGGRPGDLWRDVAAGSGLNLPG